MYDYRRDQIEKFRLRFEEQRANGSAQDTLDAAKEYLDALTDFIRAYNDGPAGDPHIASRIDTTGELSRVEDHAEWAEQERHRVRKVVSGIA